MLDRYERDRIRRIALSLKLTLHETDDLDEWLEELRKAIDGSEAEGTGESESLAAAIRSYARHREENTKAFVWKAKPSKATGVNKKASAGTILSSYFGTQEKTAKIPFEFDIPEVKAGETVVLMQSVIFTRGSKGGLEAVSTANSGVLIDPKAVKFPPLSGLEQAISVAEHTLVEQGMQLTQTTLKRYLDIVTSSIKG